MGRIRRGIRPNKSNKNGFAINRILGEKLAASVLEFADLGRIQDANLPVGPIESPLVGLRIVYAQGKTFDVAGWAIELDLIQTCAIPNLAADTSAVKFDPSIGARQRIQAALQMIFPGTNQGVKIVLAILLLRSRDLLHARISFRRVGILRLLRSACFVRVRVRGNLACVKDKSRGADRAANPNLVHSHFLSSG